MANALIKSNCRHLIVLLLSFSFQTLAQFPSPALIGYWHNWNDVNAPYISLTSVDSRYNVIQVAFAIPEQGTDYKMQFIPDQVLPAVFAGQVQALQSQGRKVLISVGGATAPVSLDNISERDTFVSRMNQIINTYGFDGMDIDLEGSSVTVSGGTIATPVDAKIIHLIDAVKQIMHDYYATHGKRMLLTIAPETAFVQGGMSAFGGIWGAYLPVIHALRDSLAVIHVQLYNSGSMYGIDGNIYTQGTTDFIIAMTEAIIQGFNTSGGMFTGIPAGKVAVGLPACPSAAGGGYVSPDSVKAAMHYLLGTGPKPGTYTLINQGGYPNLSGMMTWSVNWDAVSNCATAYQYAQSFEDIFLPASVSGNWVYQTSFLIHPNPASDFISIKTSFLTCGENHACIFNSQGQWQYSQIIYADDLKLCISHLSPGLYFIRLNRYFFRFIKN